MPVVMFLQNMLMYRQLSRITRISQRYDVRISSEKSVSRGDASALYAWGVGSHLGQNSKNPKQVLAFFSVQHMSDHYLKFRSSRGVARWGEWGIVRQPRAVKFIFYKRTIFCFRQILD